MAAIVRQSLGVTVRTTTNCGQTPRVASQGLFPEILEQIVDGPLESAKNDAQLAAEATFRIISPWIRGLHEDLHPCRLPRSFP